MHYEEDGLKEKFEPDEKKINMLNNHIIDQFEDLKNEFAEDHFITIQAKKDVDFLLRHYTSEIRLLR